MDATTEPRMDPAANAAGRAVPPPAAARLASAPLGQPPADRCAPGSTPPPRRRSRSMTARWPPRAAPPDAYAHRAKADNTRRAYRAGVRAWCAWCDQHALPCLPARAADVAAFLAAEHGRGASVATIELRRAAIRYLHFIAGCPVPTAQAPGRRDHGRHPPHRRRQRRAAGARNSPPPPTSCARSSPRSATTWWGCATAPCCWSASPEPCGAPSWRRSGSSISRRASAACASPCRAPRATAPAAASPSPSPTAPPNSARCARCAAGRTPPASPRARCSAASGGRRRRRKPGEAPRPCPVLGTAAIDAGTVARIVKARAAAAGFDPRALGGHSLKRGALTTGMDRGVHPTRLKQLGRHKSYAVLDEYLELGDPFDSHPLSGVL